MTAQIGDLYTYDGAVYTYFERSNEGLFDPADYGFRPTECMTACWRGFWCEYEIYNDRLKLQRLSIHDENDHYPPINGVRISPTEYWSTTKNGRKIPTDIPRYGGHQIYDNLGLDIQYTGKLLFASDFIKEYSVYGGPQLHGFKTVQTFEFENGELKKVVDHSDIARMIREIIGSGNKQHWFGKDDYEKIPEGTRETMWWVRIAEERHRKTMREFIEWLEETGKAEDAEAFSKLIPEKGE